MDLAKTFKTDQKKEEEGVWEKLGADAEVLVARHGNPNFQKLFRRLTSGMSKGMRKRVVLSHDDQEAIMIQCMAKTILLDWKGLTDDGVLVVYSVEKAIQLMTKYSDFADTILEISMDMANFKVDDDKEKEGNSEGV